MWNNDLLFPHTVNQETPLVGWLVGWLVLKGVFLPLCFRRLLMRFFDGTSLIAGCSFRPLLRRRERK